MATLQQALAEAYASAPQNEIVLDSLEVDHPSFTTPIRVINWPVTGNELEKFYCKLEDAAPANPGEVVEYFGAPVEILPPDKENEGSGRYRLRIDDVGNRLDRYMEDAVLGGGMITAVYREFIKGREGEGPCAVSPVIVLTSPRSEASLTFSIEGVMLNWIFRGFGQLMLPGDYPTLVVNR